MQICKYRFDKNYIECEECDGKQIECEFYSQNLIDINSIDELIALIKEVDDKLIVSDEDITIYDDYVE